MALDQKLFVLVNFGIGYASAVLLHRIAFFAREWFHIVTSPFFLFVSSLSVSKLRMFDALWSLCLSFDAIKQELSCDPIVTALYLLGKLGRVLVVVH